MSDRNLGRQIVKNDAIGYADILDRRGRKDIKQYKTRRLPDVPQHERRSYTQLKYTYKTGDKLYKIAHKHYGSAKYWWIIAWWNKRPTDFDYRVGDTIFIPFPLKEILYLVNTRD